MAYLDDKRVFLAGATGLAGAAVLKHLLRRSGSVRLRASLHSNKKPPVQDPRIEYVPGDLASQDDCRRMLRGCDCAIMAAASGGGAAVLTTEAWRQVNANLFMGAQLLEACSFEKVRRLVLANSATLYQEFQGAIKEDALDLNRDPHPAHFGIGWVTRSVEKLACFWHNQCGMDVIVGRTSNIFGPYARFDPAASNFIPALIRKAVDKMDPFEVWGSPDVTRDVLFVDDFAEAIAAMLEHDEIQFDVFNLGSGQRTTVGDIVRWALKYANHQPSDIRYVKDKPTTTKFRALDCSKAERLLGWRPRISVEMGVAKTVEWWIANKATWKR